MTCEEETPGIQPALLSAHDSPLRIALSSPMNLGITELRKKLSNSSTNSSSNSYLTADSDCGRKMSNDSGISALSSNTDKESPPTSAPPHHQPHSADDELIAEPRLASLQHLLTQQSLSAASFNTAALLGMQTNNILSPSSLWSSPLAASLLHQQQEATRKAMESAANGKSEDAISVV